MKGFVISGEADGSTFAYFQFELIWFKKAIVVIIDESAADQLKVLVEVRSCLEAAVQAILLPHDLLHIRADIHFNSAFCIRTGFSECKNEEKIQIAFEGTLLSQT